MCYLPVFPQLVLLAKGTKGFPLHSHPALYSGCVGGPGAAILLLGARGGLLSTSCTEAAMLCAEPGAVVIVLFEYHLIVAHRSQFPLACGHPREPALCFAPLQLTWVK